MKSNNQNHQPPSPDISQEVITQIKTQKIGIKPRFYFILANFLLFVGLVFAIFVGIFFFNLVLFKFRSLSNQGCLCWNTFINNFWSEFPWVPLLIAVVGIGSGYLLLKKFKFIYQKNQLLILIGVVFFSILTALTIDQLHLNEKISHNQLYPFYCSTGQKSCPASKPATELNICPNETWYEPKKCDCHQE